MRKEAVFTEEFRNNGVRKKNKRKVELIPVPAITSLKMGSTEILVGSVGQAIQTSAQDGD